VSLGADVCLYEPWFAVMTYVNTDDRFDPDYCPSGNTIPAYQSWIYDIAGRLEQSYWAPYAEYGYPYGFFDVVPNGIASGAIRVRTQGYNRPENACPILPDDYWYKVGMTDFTQYYPGVPGPAYCGPAAGANSVWWFACVDSQFPPSWGGCNPGDEIALINQIAAAAGTDPVLGTNCDALEAALIGLIKAAGGWWFEETTVYPSDFATPDSMFWYLQYKLRTCEDIVLLLGFWQEDPPGTWNRFGGHFVTLAGVDYTNYAFALSDPATPEGYNNYFVAWPSVSPGGLLYLLDYYLPWPDFQGQNAGPLPNTGTYNPLLPVNVEVEQAIVVSPGLKEMSDTVNSSKATEVENNHGGIDAFSGDFGAGLQSGLYKGSFVIGTSQADLACDYGDYYPLSKFIPLGAPDTNSFVVDGAAGPYTVEQLTLKFAHPFIPNLEITKYAFGFWVPVGGTEDCEYVIDIIIVLRNTGATDILGLEKAVWLDYDISAGGTGDLADYDQQHQSMWMWDQAVPNAVFGMTKKPFDAPKQYCCVIEDKDGEKHCNYGPEWTLAKCEAWALQAGGFVSKHREHKMCNNSTNCIQKGKTGYAFSQAARVYDGQYMDSLKIWMETLGWGIDEPTIPQDKSIIIASDKFDLPAGAIHIEKWNIWIYLGPIAQGGDANWRKYLYNVFNQEGFYRGDVNKDGKLNVTDVIYLINYLFKGGPKPVDFVDQGDVNIDGNANVTDVIYEINYLFKNGPAPIDELRFFMESPFVDTLHKALGTRDPGLFGDDDWKGLGQ
jgi:hypothetical protein